MPRAKIFVAFVVVCLAVVGGWCWYQRRLDIKHQEANCIVQVLNRMQMFEHGAAQKEQQDPSHSWQFFLESCQQITSIDTTGCPIDFKIEFSHCVDALNRFRLDATDLIQAKKTGDEQFLQNVVIDVFTRGLLGHNNISSDQLVNQAQSAIIKDRDELLNDKEKLTDIAIKYNVNFTPVTSASVTPGSHVAAPPVAVSKSLTVPARTQSDLPLSFAPNASPGRLTGHWTAKGKSANVKGATDDTLVGFTIKDLDNKIIQRLDHPMSGSFDIHYNGGTYTLIFDNTGILRSSDRLVTVEWTYQQD